MKHYRMLSSCHATWRTTHGGAGMVLNTSNVNFLSATMNYIIQRTECVHKSLSEETSHTRHFQRWTAESPSGVIGREHQSVWRGEGGLWDEIHQSHLFIPVGHLEDLSPLPHMPLACGMQGESGSKQFKHLPDYRLHLLYKEVIIIVLQCMLS